MNVRRFIHDPEELLREGKEIAKHSADKKFLHRVSMVNLILGGMSTKSLSECCGNSARTLTYWVKKVDEKGWDALADKKHTGRASVLSDIQLEEIKKAISSSPENYGYHVWDGPTLSDFIKNTYNINYSVRASQKLFHRLGFSLIRPQTYPSLENPDNEAREVFKKNSSK